jgi:hypothetical protein
VLPIGLQVLCCGVSLCTCVSFVRIQRLSFIFLGGDRRLHSSSNAQIPEYVFSEIQLESLASIADNHLETSLGVSDALEVLNFPMGRFGYLEFPNGAPNCRKSIFMNYRISAREPDWL